jgi:hypothetical protein
MNTSSWSVQLVMGGMLLSALACNSPLAPAGSQPGGPAQPTAFGPPTETSTPLPPTATITPTLAPTDTATPTATPTPQDPVVAPAGGKDVVCRFGPGAEFSIDGALRIGEVAPVSGRNELASWLQIENPRRPGKYCWVAAGETSLEGDWRLAPVLPPPLSIVTAVVVELHPSTLSVPGCVFPATFGVTFRITTTGPATVSFQRQLSSGATAPKESVEFLASGSMEFIDSYKVGQAGEHWFAVNVSSPNVISGRGYGQAECP